MVVRTLERALVSTVLCASLWSCNIAEDELPPPEVSDTESPSIVSFSVSNGEQGVLLDATFTITFSEPMSMTSVGQAVELREQLSGRVVVVDVVTDGAVVTVTPVGVLGSGVLHELTVDTQANDLAGNPLTAPANVLFTTVDDVAPSVVSFSVAAGAQDVPLDAAITVTCSEAMAPASVASAVSLTGPGGAVDVVVEVVGAAITVTPTSELEGRTTYTLELSVVATDEAGNPLEEPGVVEFTTEPLPVPLDSVVPADGAVGVEIIVTTVTLSYPMMLEAGSATPENVVVTDASGQRVSGTLATQGGELVFEAREPWKEFEEVYTVTVNPEALALEQRVRAVDGNPLESTTSTFTTELISREFFYRIKNLESREHMRVTPSSLRSPTLDLRPASDESGDDVQRWFVTETGDRAYPWALTNKLTDPFRYINGGALGNGSKSRMSERPGAGFGAAQMFEIARATLPEDARVFFTIRNMEHGDAGNIARLDDADVGMAEAEVDPFHFWEFVRLERR